MWISHGINYIRLLTGVKDKMCFVGSKVQSHILVPGFYITNVARDFTHEMFCFIWLLMIQNINHQIYSWKYNAKLVEENMFLMFYFKYSFSYMSYGATVGASAANSNLIKK